MEHTGMRMMTMSETEKVVEEKEADIWTEQEEEVAEAVAERHKEHQSHRRTEPSCPSVRPVHTRDRSSIIEPSGRPRGGTIAAVCRSLRSILTAGR